MAVKHKIVNDKLTEMTAVDLDFLSQLQKNERPPTPTDAERITQLEDQLAAMQSAYSRGVQDA